MAVRDVVVAATGAAVILVAAFAVVVVEQRAGPFVHDLAPAEVLLALQGTYRATAAQGVTLPGGTCLPEPPSLACSPPRTVVDLRVAGLPILADGLHYVAALVGGANAPFPLGPLAWDGNVHTLAHDGDQDSRDREEIVVVLATDPGDTAPDRALLRITVGPRDSDDLRSLAGPATATLGTGAGRVTLHQIGAVTVSATLDARISGLPAPADGTEYRAWLRAPGRGDGAAGVPVFTPIGTLRFEQDDPGTATVGGRAERVRLPDLDLFVVTLEPVGETAVLPTGFPVVAAAL